MRSFVKTSIIFVAFFMVAIIAQSQSFVVQDARNSYLLVSKAKLKKNDTISIHNKIIVKDTGNIHLSFKSGWSFYIRSKGIYNLDSCYKIHHQINKIHDSVYFYLEKHNLINCNFKETDSLIALAPSINSVSDKYITINNTTTKKPFKVKMVGDTLQIKWAHLHNYTGVYFVCIKNLYNDYVYIESTKKNSYLINTKKIKIKPYYRIRIISSDCRASEEFTIL